VAPEVRVFGDAEELGTALASEVLELVAAVDSDRFLLGCPGGRSLRSTYRALAARRDELRKVTVVMMDEYVEDGRSAPPGAHYSCRRFALEEIAVPLGVSERDVWLPDPGDPESYDERIAAAGGIDLFLLASGASDGHVAFVPPGSTLDGRTSVVALADSTRRDNLATFPEFRSLDEVPRHGVTVGLATIRGARRARLVLHGPEKRAAARRLLDLDRFDSAWPVSVIYECVDAQILLDRAALPRT
jgi:glucosamine-6-phosphate deaminase